MELVTDKLISKEEYSASARQRSSVYGLLALFYRREPDEDLIRFLRQPEILRGLAEAGLTLNVFAKSNELCDGPIEAVIQRLETEYTRLFIGPGKHVSLNESVHRDSEGLLFGKSTVAVKGFIEAIGLDLDLEWSGLPDHISVEMELMQRLTDYEARLWIEYDLDSVRQCVGTEQEFLQRHILQWVPCLCNKILDQNPMSFYREINKLTLKFIAFESKYIDDLTKTIVHCHDKNDHKKKKSTKT